MTLQRQTPLVRKAAKPKRKPAAHCSWSNRCKRRPSVTVSESELLCKTHATWVADKLVGDYVKARDRRLCQRCAALGSIQWAHVISRGARYIRWDVENSMALCAGCHMHFTRNPAAWATFVEKNWPGRWTRLVHREIAGERAGGSIDLAEIITRFRQEAA